MQRLRGIPSISLLECMCRCVTSASFHLSWMLCSFHLYILSEANCITEKSPVFRWSSTCSSSSSKEVSRMRGISVLVYTICEAGFTALMKLRVTLDARELCSFHSSFSINFLYKEFRFLGYNAVYSGESQSTFRRDVSALSAGLKSKQSKKPEWSCSSLPAFSWCLALLSLRPSSMRH